MYIKAYKGLIGLYRFIIAYKGLYWWSFPFKMLEMLETFETFQMDLDAPPPGGGCVCPRRPQLERGSQREWLGYLGVGSLIPQGSPQVDVP